MNDGNDGCMIVLMILLFVAVVCAATFFEWQAYVQTIGALGAEPSIPAFIGWMLFSS